MSERAGPGRAGRGSARRRLPDPGCGVPGSSPVLGFCGFRGGRGRLAESPSSSPPPAAASLSPSLSPRWRRCSRSAASPPKLFPALRSAPRRCRRLPPSYKKKKRPRRGRESSTRGRRPFCLKPPTFRPFLSSATGLCGRKAAGSGRWALG